MTSPTDTTSPTATDTDGKTIRMGDTVSFDEDGVRSGVIDSILVETRDSGWWRRTVTVLTLKVATWDSSCAYTKQDAEDCWLTR